MARAHLVACPSCARHVRVSDESCPFCSKGLDSALRARPAPLPPTMRLSRAALAAFGAGTVALSAGCGSTPSIVSAEAGVDTIGSTRFTTSTEQHAVTLPGGNTPSSAGSTVTATTLSDTTETDTNTTVPPYGISPTTSGMDTSTSTESSETSSTAFVTFYGGATGMDAGTTIYGGTSAMDSTETDESSPIDAGSSSSSSSSSTAASSPSTSVSSASLGARSKLPLAPGDSPP